MAKMERIIVEVELLFIIDYISTEELKSWSVGQLVELCPKN